MQVWVSVAIMQAVFSAVHYADDCFSCNYAVDSFCCSYVGDGFKKQFISLPLTPTFCKIDWKTLKSIISGLHFTTFVNIFVKLDTLRVEVNIKIG